MRLLIFLGTIFFLTSSADKCDGKDKNANGEKHDTVHKGRLEIKGLCMNYTISVSGGTVDTAWTVSEWKDDHSGKSYKNVFALGSKCTFPSNINEGDEFYFRIDSSQAQDCPVCMAYYPVPPKQLMIKVVEK